mmetsp:Transcript_63497/g.104887  ORF Transcript_63497/g.104887 Transcript_63497/m.104887 type:complete len:241 (+) Transcript_63497:923-1645(+)
MIISRSNKSTGIPWGDWNSVPRMVEIPLLLAMIMTGDVGCSRARFKKEKHSMSNICTSSMKSTPGITSALPSSRHSNTLLSICSRTSCLISPVSPANNAKNPCARELMTSISCNVTVCTTSLRFCSSPSGHCTNRVLEPIASKSFDREKERPNLEILPLALSMVMMSPAATLSLVKDSIIFCPKSYTVSISVVFRIMRPVFPGVALLGSVAGRSISISTTSPSTISVSSLMRTPIDRRNA